MAGSPSLPSQFIRVGELGQELSPGQQALELAVDRSNGSLVMLKQTKLPNTSLAQEINAVTALATLPHTHVVSMLGYFFAR